MSLTAENLVVDWINVNTRYKAVKGPAPISGPYNKAAIKIYGDRQIAWLYLEPIKRWDVEAGLYFLADMADNPASPACHKLPSIGDPDYFKALTTCLENGPKPF